MRGRSFERRVEVSPTVVVEGAAVATVDIVGVRCECVCVVGVVWQSVREREERAKSGWE